MSTQAANTARGNKPPGPSQAGLFLLVKPYKGLVATLAVLTILANGLNLVVPKLIASAIDNYRLSLTDRFQHFGKEIAIGVFHARIHRQVTQDRVLKVFL